jgi:hypothetical protein
VIRALQAPQWRSDRRSESLLWPKSAWRRPLRNADIAFNLSQQCLQIRQRLFRVYLEDRMTHHAGFAEPQVPRPLGGVHRAALGASVLKGEQGLSGINVRHYKERVT